jgi:hypothetical protein
VAVNVSQLSQDTLAADNDELFNDIKMLEINYFVAPNPSGEDEHIRVAEQRTVRFEIF